MVWWSQPGCEGDGGLFSGPPSGISATLNRSFKSFGKMFVAKALARYMVNIPLPKAINAVSLSAEIRNSSPVVGNLVGLDTAGIRRPLPRPETPK